MAIYLRAKGRTSPPAKTIGHHESINPTLAVLKWVAKYLVTTIYFNMLQKKRGQLQNTPKRLRTYVCTYVLTAWVPVVGFRKGIAETIFGAPESGGP